MRSDLSVNADRLPKALSAAADRTQTAEICIERQLLLLETAAETLLAAINNVRREFSFLHQRARKDRLATATEQLESLFDPQVSDTENYVFGPGRNCS